MSKHWKRLGLALLGRWDPSMQEGRKSAHKGYVGEILHALKNVLVEWLRATGIYDRPSQPDGR